MRLVRGVRRRFPHLPILCVSIDGPTRETRELDPVGHLMKPFRRLQLERAIELALIPQADVVEEKEMLNANAILTTRAALSDLLMKDLEAVETRLGRDLGAAEKSVLQKLADALMSEKPVSTVSLTPDELTAISAHNFYSHKPVVVAEEAELAATAVAPSSIGLDSGAAPRRSSRIQPLRGPRPARAPAQQELSCPER